MSSVEKKTFRVPNFVASATSLLLPNGLNQSVMLSGNCSFEIPLNFDTSHIFNSLPDIIKRLSTYNHRLVTNVLSERRIYPTPHSTIISLLPSHELKQLVMPLVNCYFKFPLNFDTSHISYHISSRRFYPMMTHALSGRRFYPMMTNFFAYTKVDKNFLVNSPWIEPINRYTIEKLLLRGSSDFWYYYYQKSSNATLLAII